MASTLAPAHNGAVADLTVNAILAALAPGDLAAISNKLEIGSYSPWDVMSEAHEPASHVYFPLTCVCSIINTVAGGSTVEVGTVGNEGFVGVAVYLGAGSTPNKTIVQVPGYMARLSTGDFVKLLERSDAMRKLLDRFTLAFLSQVSQTAACNRAHTIDERCARWLLMTHDRVGMDTFALTHEFLAFMLGVRRAGVTVAAGILQKAGLISYKRGKVSIVDRAGLEAASCDCYQVVRSEFKKLMSYK